MQASYANQRLRVRMIQLTRINHVPLVLNSDLIEHIETTPDTVISLMNGQKFIVIETIKDVVEKVIEFRSAIQRRAAMPAAG